MSVETLFYIFGIALTAWALIVSFFGLRNERFPTPGVMRATVAVFAALVGTTAVFAVASAREEQEHREQELAHEEEAAGPESGAEPGGEVQSGGELEGESELGGGEVEGGGQRPEEGGGQQPGQGERPDGQRPRGGEAPTATVLRLSASETELAYNAEELSAPAAGELTIILNNPSAVPHDVVIEAGGEDLAAAEEVTEGETSLTTTLQPGSYVFYCSVPGHREAGMEGTLTVR